MIPNLLQLHPNRVPVGTQFTIVVYGNAFAPGAVILWNGAPLPNVILAGRNSANRLFGDVTFAQTAAAGTVSVTVQNPGPVVSSALTFTIFEGFPECQHPYDTQLCNSTYKVPGNPASIWVTFDPQTYAYFDLYPDPTFSDWINVNNGGVYSENFQSVDLAGRTLQIPGDTVNIQFGQIPLGTNTQIFNFPLDGSFDTVSITGPVVTYLSGSAFFTNDGLFGSPSNNLPGNGATVDPTGTPAFSTILSVTDATHMTLTSSPGDTASVAFQWQAPVTRTNYPINIGGNYFGWRVTDIRTTPPPYRLGNRNSIDQIDSTCFSNDSFSTPPYFGPQAATHPSPQILPEVAAGKPYGYQFRFPSATGSVTWSLVSGSLPPGITLNANTAIGTTAISDPGANNYTVGDVGQIDNACYGSVALYVITAVDGGGGVTGYSLTYTGANYGVGAAVTTTPWSGNTSGNYFKVNIVSMAAANGAISGTAPATPGSFQFIIRGTDSLGKTAEGTYLLRVFENPILIQGVFSPASDDVFPPDSIGENWFFEWNGAMYAVYIFRDHTGGNFIQSPVVKKSIDQGLTWTVVNVGDTTTFATTAMDVFHAGDTIYYAFGQGAVGFALAFFFNVKSYNLLTNTYTDIYTGQNYAVGFDTGAHSRLFVKPNSSIVQFFTGTPDLAITALVYMVSNNGATTTLISTNVPTAIGAGREIGVLAFVAMDATGAFHVFYFVDTKLLVIVNTAGVNVTRVSGDFFPASLSSGFNFVPTINSVLYPAAYVDDSHITVTTGDPGTQLGVDCKVASGDFYYVRVAPDLSVGAPVHLSSSYFYGNDFINSTEIGAGYVRANQDEIIVPFAMRTPIGASSNNRVLGVMRGAPLSAPTFTYEWVDCAVNNDQSNEQYFAPFATGTWAVEGLDSSDNIFFTGFDQYLSNTNFGATWLVTNKRDGAGWSYRDRYYDSVTLPGDTVSPLVDTDPFTFFNIAYPDSTSPSGWRYAFLQQPGVPRAGIFTLAYPSLPLPPAHEIVTARLFGPHSPSKMAMKATSVTANGVTSVRLTPLNPTHSPTVPMMLFRNHLLLTEGLDYTRSGLWVTLLSGSEVIQTAPFIAVISMGGAATSSFDGSISGAINGSNTVFTIASFALSQAMLFQNGKLLTETKEYRRISNLVFFTAAPLGGDVLTAQVYSSVEPGPTQVTTFDRSLDYSQASKSLIYRNGLLMTQPADALTTGDTAALRPAQVPQSDDIVTLEAWTFDVSDPGNPPALLLPTQYSTVDGSITGVRNGINNIFVIQTSRLVTDLLLAYNGLGMTQGIDYSWACVQNSSAGPWVTTITMMSGQNPADDGLLTAEVFGEE